MVALLHHDSLVDHVTSATGIFVIALVVVALLGVFAYVKR